jgi:hypothetical protein
LFESEWEKKKTVTITAARCPIFRPNNSKEAPKNVHGRKKLEAVKMHNLDNSGRKEAGKYLYNYLEEKPYHSLYFLRFFLRNLQKICNNIEFFGAFIIQKESEKMLCTVVSVVAEFFQIFRLL